VADTNWYLTKELESGGGSFDPGRGIRVGDGAGFASGKNGPGGITLHEQQHVIQGIEDFGRGGNRDFGNKADDVRREAQKAYEASMARPVDDPDVALLRELGIELPPPPTVPWDQLPARKQLEWHEAGRGRAYNALAGETEARTVQKRMDLTPEERRARPPWLDYDVPEADQIVRFSEGKSGSSASMTPGGDGAFTLPSAQAASKGERISGKADSQGGLNQTTAEFLKERYGGSEDYSPLRGYHGASMPYEGGTYNPRKSQYKAFFGAENPELANNFARSYGDNPRVYPVEVSPSANMFDPANPEHSAKIVAAFDKNPSMLSGFLMGKDSLRRMLAEGDGGLMESAGVQQWLRKNKFDGWRFQDTAAPPSADGKRGAFGMIKPGFVHSSTTGDLLYSNPKESAAIPAGIKALESRALPMDMESKLARAREMGYDTP
jgi:hypothetical protein